jgi:hypothetical protein
MAIFDFSEHGPTPHGSAAPAPKPSGAGPPFKTALAILVLAAALAGWRWYIDDGKGIAPGIFAETFSLHWPQPPAPVVPKIATTKPNEKLPQISPVFTDDSSSLDPFFSALWKLEQSRSQQGKEGGVVTILHYGDSPTTADLITGDVRAQRGARLHVDCETVGVVWSPRRGDQRPWLEGAYWRRPDARGNLWAGRRGLRGAIRRVEQVQAD